MIYFRLLIYQLKLDTETKKRSIWFEENHLPSEPIFVATPGAQSEDDGKLH